jgi:hypothetical protein
MRNRRNTFGLLALAIVLAATIGWYRLAPGTAPVGQPPLATLDSTSLQALQTDFNRESNHARVIVLLSPT